MVVDDVGCSASMQSASRLGILRLHSQHHLDIPTKRKEMNQSIIAVWMQRCQKRKDVKIQIGKSHYGSISIEKSLVLYLHEKEILFDSWRKYVVEFQCKE